MLWVFEDIFKSEEVDHFICSFSLIDPVLHPLPVGFDTTLLEVFPILIVWLLNEIVLEGLVVSHGEDKIEQGWVTIDLISSADHSNIVLERRLEWEPARVMSLPEKSRAVGDSLCQETTVLKCDIWVMFKHHIRSRDSSSHILEVLAHKTVTRSWPGCIHDGELLSCCASSVSWTPCEVSILYLLIFIEVL